MGEHTGMLTLCIIHAYAVPSCISSVAYKAVAEKL
jgi:hypothetical protein